MLPEGDRRDCHGTTADYRAVSSRRGDDPEVVNAYHTMPLDATGIEKRGRLDALAKPENHFTSSHAVSSPAYETREVVAQRVIGRKEPDISRHGIRTNEWIRTGEQSS